MQFASALPSLEPTPRPPASAFGLVTGVNNGEVANSWLQVPPTHMPWGNPAAHQPSIVRFTAEPLDKPGPSGLNSSPFGQCKRKIDVEMPLPAPKQLITEEKMAAHMRQLHISNSYTSHDEPTMEGTIAPKPDPGINMASTVPAEELAYKRLVLCEELRQLQNEPLLPSSLLASMQRPSMALVLWRPPAGKVSDTLRQAAASASREEMEEEQQQQPRRLRQQQQMGMPAQFPSISLDNNNTTGTIDLNTVHRFGQSSFVSPTDAETMDL